MPERLTVRRTIRLKASEYDQIVEEAKEFGYQISSLMRIKLLGRFEGLYLSRAPMVDMPALIDAASHASEIICTLHKIYSVLLSIDDRLDKGTNDLFGLDGCMRELGQTEKDVREVSSLITKALIPRFLTPPVVNRLQTTRTQKGQ